MRRYLSIAESEAIIASKEVVYRDENSGRLTVGGTGHMNRYTDTHENQRLIKDYADYADFSLI